jgi:hemoglobin
MTDVSPPPEATLRPLIEAFYERVRADPELGPVFEEGVHDWKDHHDRLIDFWQTVAFGVPRYKGNPVAMHMRHASSITPALFEKWLDLWRDTTESQLPMPLAKVLQAKAQRIAQTLGSAIRSFPSPSPNQGA